MIDLVEDVPTRVALVAVHQIAAASPTYGECGTTSTSALSREDVLRFSREFQPAIAHVIATDKLRPTPPRDLLALATLESQLLPLIPERQAVIIDARSAAIDAIKQRQPGSFAVFSNTLVTGMPPLSETDVDGLLSSQRVGATFFARDDRAAVLKQYLEDVAVLGLYDDAALRGYQIARDLEADGTGPQLTSPDIRAAYDQEIKISLLNASKDPTEALLDLVATLGKCEPDTWLEDSLRSKLEEIRLDFVRKHAHKIGPQISGILLQPGLPPVSAHEARALAYADACGEIPPRELSILLGDETSTFAEECGVRLTEMMRTSLAGRRTSSDPASDTRAALQSLSKSIPYLIRNGHAVPVDAKTLVSFTTSIDTLGDLGYTASTSLRSIVAQTPLSNQQEKALVARCIAAYKTISAPGHTKKQEEFADNLTIALEQRILGSPKKEAHLNQFRAMFKHQWYSKVPDSFQSGIELLVEEWEDGVLSGARDSARKIMEALGSAT